MALARDALTFSLQFVDGAHRSVLPRHRVGRWLRAALEAPTEIAVRIVGAAEGLRLNREFRGQAHATNVLTFGYNQSPRIVADLVLCAPVVAREAKAMGVSIEAHYAHLLVHGALHAQGFDHEHSDEAAAMEARESAIVTALGFADPYEASARPRPRTARKVARRSRAKFPAGPPLAGSGSAT